jgi:23S rRNA (cytosine1962-C5)-methyltransferase
MNPLVELPYPPRVILKPKRAQPFFARHPWVFTGAIDKIVGNAVDGQTADLYSSSGHFVGRGLYNSQSKIRLRVYEWKPDILLDEHFWTAKIRNAIALRQHLQLRGSEKGCRLVFSEGDGLTGLTVDEYGSWLVVQITALGLGLRKELLAEILAKETGCRGIYLRTEKGIGLLEGLAIEDGLLWGEAPPPDMYIVENNLKIHVNLAEGQKTGYYLDQRENRPLIGRLGIGRTVLDTFCFTGGFGLQAAYQGASQVDCVDISEPALQIAKLNAHSNQLNGRMNFIRSDVFKHLTNLVAEGRKYGLVILDPPKFARNRNAITEALNGYRRLITLSLQLLEENGYLVMCCCTGLIQSTDLETLFSQIMASQKCEIQILSKLGQGADHPIMASCVESNYLKCYILRIT